MAVKVGTVRILYGAGTISLQAAVHPKCMLGALNMKEESEDTIFSFTLCNGLLIAFILCWNF